MSSNILAGERRWASARRTGMTVLGKVAVPKPINLPSQRLENHGLDPSVEIVPKGTLGWGSRPSSSASNPWGSSSLSSTAEGYGSSPGHPSGRPSSSGSRPSTAGSEITHDRSGNAWGLSSRPSSASGTSASNQTSLTSLRPHSAETRPASSQISRFAEPYTDSAVAHQPNVTTEKAGLASSSEKERFSLTSADFPTLNSTTDGSLKNSDSQVAGQGSDSRPNSASGRVAEEGNSEMTKADVESGTVNAWNRGGYRNSDDSYPSMEKWQGEPPRFPNVNAPPSQFDGWRGPPMNHPGVWYRGLPPGPPYGAPMPPGGFPMEPFPFYCPPQMPPSGLATSQAVPPPGPGPMGHPKNGELYRPRMPDAFVRPGMPLRPGFYRGPMPFDGYYGPPMGYCNPNEREVPFQGMAAVPPVSNRYPARDSDPVPFNMADANDSTTSHSRMGKNGPSVKRLSEKVETAHFDYARGQALLKQNGDVKQEGQNRENMAAYDFPNAKKISQRGMELRTKEWGADCNSEDDMYSRSATHGLHSCAGPSDEQRGSDLVTIRLKPHDSRDNVAVDDAMSKKLEIAASSSPVLPHAPLAGDGDLTSSAISRDPTLMRKIEGLNEKVRASDCRNEGLYPSQWEDQKGTGAIIGEIMVPLGDKTSHPTAALRRCYGDVRGKADDNSKQNFNAPGGVNVWQKKPAPVQASDHMSTSNVHESRTNTNVVATENLPERPETESEVADSTDNQSQRSKMRELAKQRALQLQKEEEERTREQKAKALAKLEELNRRTPGGNSVIPKDEKVLPSSISKQEQGPQTFLESRTVAKFPSHSPPLVITPDVRTQASESAGEWGEEPADSENYSSFETSKTALLNPAVLPGQSLLLKEELPSAGDGVDIVAPHLNEAGAVRNKQSGYKQKQKVSTEINGSRKTTMTKDSSNSTELAGRDIAVVSPVDVGSSGDSKMADIPNVAVESSSQQRRRSNRNNKNRPKPDDLPSASTFPSTPPDESNQVELSTDNEMSKAAYSDMDKGLIQTPISGGEAGESSKQQSSLFSEGGQGSMNFHRKFQQSRRIGRNQQTYRFVDKYHGNDNVVWAPVQQQNKVEPATQNAAEAVHESVVLVKNEDQVLNNIKSKRAEMERYVPKPVAKELAQQGAVQQSGSSSVEVSMSDDATEKMEAEFKTSGKQSNLVAGNFAPVAEFQVGDVMHNKQTKTLGGWRQRSSLQQRTKGAQSGSSLSISSPSKNVPVSMGQNESVEPELINIKTEQPGLRELSASDAGNEWNNSGAGILPHGRDQGNTGRAKRHALKDERSMESDREHDKNSSNQRYDRGHMQLQDPRINQSDKNTSPKENRVHEERASSQWQPKSGSAQSVKGGGSTSTGQGVAGEAGGAVKKRHQSLPEEDASQNVKCSGEIDSQVVQSIPENSIFIEGHVGNQGQRRERKLSSSKGRPYSPGEGSVGEDESTITVSEENQNMQHISSDYRRNRYQNVRPTANREFRGDLNQERHVQNRQYEYQPVGPKDDKRFENFEGGSHPVGPRYKERGHSNSRRGRGHFHGRQSNVQVDAGYG